MGKYQVLTCVGDMTWWKYVINTANIYALYYITSSVGARILFRENYKKFTKIIRANVLLFLYLTLLHVAI
jgi:hypothetical protein